jgi:hypothetical protein
MCPVLQKKRCYHKFSFDKENAFLKTNMDIKVAPNYDLLETEECDQRVETTAVFDCNYKEYFGSWMFKKDAYNNFYFESDDTIKRIITELVNVEKKTMFKYIVNDHINLCGDSDGELYFVTDNKYNRIKKGKQLNSAWCEPFNADIAIGLEIQKLVKIFDVKHIIETGTSGGASSLFMALNNPTVKVDTIEIIKTTYKNTENRFKVDNEPYKQRKLQLGKLSKLFEKYNKFDAPPSNVKIHLGSSTDVLPNLLTKIQHTTLFYLDAHWYDYWPLLTEIEIIGKYLKDDAIIVIDDFKVPFRNYGYDSYKDTACDFEYIKNSLPHAFTDYVYYYNDKSARMPYDARGKIYIIPKRLMTQYNITTDELFRVENDISYSIN